MAVHDAMLRDNNLELDNTCFIIFYTLKFSNKFTQTQPTQISATLFLLQQNTPASSALPSPDIAALLRASKSDIDHFEGELGVPSCNSNSRELQPGARATRVQHRNNTDLLRE